MSYINRYQLIYSVLRGEPLDSKKLLAEVDRNAVIRALEKTKEGIPKSIECTNEPMEEENLAKMPQRDKELLWKIYEQIRESPEEMLPQLAALKERYPQVPCIYNYLTLAYACAKQEQEYFDMLCETTRKFPEYLFGKTTLCEYYINHNAYRKVPTILEKKFELYQHCNEDVEIFHISEVRSFYGIVGRYFALSNNIARALSCYFIVEQVGPEHITLRQLGDEILQQEVKNLGKDFTKYSSSKKKSKRGKRK